MLTMWLVRTLFTIHLKAKVKYVQLASNSSLNGVKITKWNCWRFWVQIKTTRMLFSLSDWAKNQHNKLLTNQHT